MPHSSAAALRPFLLPPGQPGRHQLHAAQLFTALFTDRRSEMYRSWLRIVMVGAALLFLLTACGTGSNGGGDGPPPDGGGNTDNGSPPGGDGGNGGDNGG